MYIKCSSELQKDLILETYTDFTQLPHLSSPLFSSLSKMETPTSIPNRQWTSSLNGISNLTLVQITIPLPGPNEILVRINAVSLNFKDGEIVQGQFNHHKAVSLPEAIVPCSDAAGEIWEVGNGVTRWKRGDRVLALPYPEYRTGRITEEMLRGGIGSSGRGE